ncbi:MAG TPA: hypothetical protein PL131_05270 [Methylotenera sp.]|nr:hypothetical protein [Methylotenera sp.]HPH05264.1 hypothetical protein [Methylotenera sp.]HPN00166.1 hypothetical protein [Methylotenera sp.]
MKIIRFFLFAALTTNLIGCASLSAPPYSPDYQTLDKLKTLNIQKMALGEFQPRDPAASVNKISLRGSSLKAQEGAFSIYLENAMRDDLKEIGVLDQASSTKIDAMVIKNDIDISGISKGSGNMEVKISILKDGNLALEKVYTTTTNFESSFAGAVAIGIGQREYPNLVRAFLKDIYNDPEFIKAVQK